MSLHRLLRNVPVLLLLAAAPVFLAPPAFAADAPALPPGVSLPPGVTPQQAEAAKQAIQSGAPLPPGAQKALEAHPELKNQLSPDLRKEVVPVNLRAIVLEGKEGADVALKAQDTLTVFPRSAFRDSPKVTISGEVRRPGAFDLKKGSRVSDLVKLAGDLTKVSWLPRAEVVRIDEKMRTFRTIYFDLGKAMAGDEKENLVLEDEDQVRIHSIWETQYKKTVVVAGDVNNPGEQILTEGMRLSDLLFKAGGFKESAYAKEGELVRREVTPRGDLVKTQTMIVFPDKALAGDPAADVPLKEYDLLVVRQIPEWAEKIVVTLSGEVQFPGAYAAKKGERLSSLITRAGGFTKDAYLKAAHFSRASTQRSQQEAIDKLTEDLELEDG